MRNLMTVGLKLLGVLAIYWAISSVGQVVVAAVFYFQGGPFRRAGDYISLPIWSVVTVFSVIFAVVLLARTEWIIDRLKIPTQALQASVTEPSHLLRIGFVVLGTFVVIEALPEIGRTFYVLGLARRELGRFDLGPVISSMLKFLLGCIVIGRSERFAQAVFPVSKSEG